MSPPGHEPVPGRGAPPLPVPLFHQRVLPCHALFLVPPAPLLQGDSLQRDAGIILALARAGAVAVFFHSSLSLSRFTFEFVRRCFVVWIPWSLLAHSPPPPPQSPPPPPPQPPPPPPPSHPPPPPNAKPPPPNPEVLNPPPPLLFLGFLTAWVLWQAPILLSRSPFFLFLRGSSKSQCSQEAATPQRFASLECRCPCLRCEPLWHHESSPSLSLLAAAWLDA